MAYRLVTMFVGNDLKFEGIMLDCRIECRVVARSMDLPAQCGTDIFNATNSDDWLGWSEQEYQFWRLEMLALYGPKFLECLAECKKVMEGYGKIVEDIK